MVKKSRSRDRRRRRRDRPYPRQRRQQRRSPLRGARRSSTRTQRGRGYDHDPYTDEETSALDRPLSSSRYGEFRDAIEAGHLSVFVETSQGRLDSFQGVRDYEANDLSDNVDYVAVPSACINQPFWLRVVNNTGTDFAVEAFMDSFDGTGRRQVNRISKMAPAPGKYRHSFINDYYPFFDNIVQLARVLL